MSAAARAVRSTSIRGLSDWLLTGLVRGAVAGALTPIIAALVALPVAVLWPRQPLPPGTTTSSSAGTSPLAAFSALMYVSILLMIASSIGSSVGATIGVVAGGAGGAIDALTRRRIAPAAIGGCVVAVACIFAIGVTLMLLDRQRDRTSSGDAAALALVALPFALSAMGLVVAPLRRGSVDPVHPLLVDVRSR